MGERNRSHRTRRGDIYKSFPSPSCNCQNQAFHFPPHIYREQPIMNGTQPTSDTHPTSDHTSLTPQARDAEIAELKTKLRQEQSAKLSLSSLPEDPSSVPLPKVSGIPTTSELDYQPAQVSVAERNLRLKNFEQNLDLTSTNAFGSLQKLAWTSCTGKKLSQFRIIHKDYSKVAQWTSKVGSVVLDPATSLSIASDTFVAKRSMSSLAK
ncbi:hypothetical protein D9611_009668 [Ephemerocybe angulata]|uniref:Uncharacterized protein n=1 Tax=Ephemerocybe angulata TaxID=980116 RepID=A0A8H5FGC2_9AGAR|nr:hypothetical protein D9611_009668 [Tulosesus angulatus]